MHPHVLFPSATYSLWHDGCLQLHVNPWELVDEYLVDGVDFATFEHPDRRCAYQELRACVILNKGSEQVMNAQMNRYRQEGYPPGRGLFETAAVLRRHTPAVQAFDALWWQQLAAGSDRDQLSVNYCIWKSKLPFAFLPGGRDENPWFNFFSHNK